MLWFGPSQANTWTELSTTGRPPSKRYDAAAVWSDAADGLYLFGGWDSSGLGLGQEGSLLPASLRLPERPLVLQPPGVAEQTFRCFVSGDALQANAWSELSATGVDPTKRHKHVAVWSDTADGFYMFGGNSEGVGRLEQKLLAEAAASMTCGSTNARCRKSEQD